MPAGARWHCQPVSAAVPRAHAHASCLGTRAGLRDRGGRGDGRRRAPASLLQPGVRRLGTGAGRPRRTRANGWCALRPGPAAAALRPGAAPPPAARSLFQGTWALPGLLAARRPLVCPGSERVGGQPPSRLLPQTLDSKMKAPAQ